MKLKMIVFADESIVRCKRREASNVEGRYQEQHIKTFERATVSVCSVQYMYTI